MVVQTKKNLKTFGFFAASSTLITITTLGFAPRSLAKPPGTSWNIQSTGLESKGACFRRAEKGMKFYDLRNITSSGRNRTGLYAEDETLGVYILCRENGSKAYIFCAGRPGSREANIICEKLDRYMEN